MGYTVENFFRKKGEIAVFLDADIDEMTAQELAEYLSFLAERRAEMDENEPADEDSDAFADWAQRHEELEDLYDEALERLELLRR